MKELFFTKYLYFFLTPLTLCSCEVFDYHPYDGNIDLEVGKDINLQNTFDINFSCWNKDTIRFIWFGDSGRSYDELEAFIKHANQNESIDFAIHAGDLIEFGSTKEYKWGVERLNKLRFPYVMIIGNHDIIGNGDKVYEKMFGYQNFKFIANDILFLCLNTNALEYDYYNPIPNFEFIESALEYPNAGIPYSSEYKRTVVAMHAPPFNEQFNNKEAQTFHKKIKEFPSLLFCLHGHTHNFVDTAYFDDDTPYYCCDNIGKRSYLIFTITPDDYYYELVKF